MLKVFVGRFSPLHFGHIKTIEKMLNDEPLEKIVIFLGSSNSSLSFKNIFSYRDRKTFIGCVYDINKENSKIHVLPIADMIDDGDWMDAIYSTIGIYHSPKEITFYCGSYLDIENFHIKPESKVVIVDRNEMNISATILKNIILNDLTIQNALEFGKKIDYDYKIYKDYLPEKIYKEVILKFRDNFLKIIGK